MNTYPLDEPHLDALRWACELHAADPARYERVRFQLRTEGQFDERYEQRAHAIGALSSPAISASLVRDLLARAGVDSARVKIRELPDGLYVIRLSACLACADRGSIEATGGCDKCYRNDRAVRMPDVQRMILALTSLAAGDRDGAMRALREVGR